MQKANQQVRKRIPVSLEQLLRLKRNIKVSRCEFHDDYERSPSPLSDEARQEQLMRSLKEELSRSFKGVIPRSMEFVDGDRKFSGTPRDAEFRAPNEGKEHPCTELDMKLRKSLAEELDRPYKGRS